jgi:hypothetical protein
MYSDFVWDEAPLAGLAWPLGTAAAYSIFAILLASRVRGGTGPLVSLETLKAANIVHNIVLIASSAIMFAGLAFEIFVRARETGSARFLVCADPSTERPSGPVYFWAYIYYLSKFYELLDTPLQLLRGKTPTHFAFQVYHHSLAMLMVWVFLTYTPALWQIGMLFNTAVHVIMYYYFLLCTLGKPPKWKRHVTRFQILQFITSLCCFAYTSNLVLGRGEACAGYGALVASTVFNATFLYQFIGIANTGSRPKKA